MLAESEAITGEKKPNTERSNINQLSILKLHTDMSTDNDNDNQNTFFASLDAFLETIIEILKAFF